MTSSGSSAMKEETFKPTESSQEADEPAESHGRRQDLTADSNVKAPGIVERAMEEVQAIAANIWEAITPSKK